MIDLYRPARVGGGVICEDDMEGEMVTIIPKYRVRQV